MSDCLFCKIIAGEIPSKKVYEDEHTYAFEDLDPKAPTHVLIIPKQHLRETLVPGLGAARTIRNAGLHRASPARKPAGPKETVAAAESKTQTAPRNCESPGRAAARRHSGWIALSRSR